MYFHLGNAATATTGDDNTKAFTFLKDTSVTVSKVPLDPTDVVNKKYVDKQNTKLDMIFKVFYERQSSEAYTLFDKGINKFKFFDTSSEAVFFFTSAVNLAAASATLTATAVFVAVALNNAVAAVAVDAAYC